MKTNIYLFVIALASIVLWSCEREYSIPPLTAPEYTGPEANLTIANLKSLYANIVNSTLIDVDYIIEAYVVGNDESGNIYKQLYLQDETGAINMGVDLNSMYTEYRVGQKVYVALKGLYMVKYGGQLQVGYDGTNANRISGEVFEYHIAKDGWPEAENAEPTPITLSQLEEKMVNMLVRLDNVYFTDGGILPYSTADATTNRTLKDGDGNSILVRNSNYASFANDLLPDGAGTIVGILSKFNNDWQFYLRTIDDVQNFGQPLPPGGEDPDPTPGETIFSETFASNKGDFTIENVLLPDGSTYVWSWDTYGYMKASAFVGGSGKASESWLISPSINTTGASSATLTFEHAVNFAVSMSSEQTVWISSNYSSGAPSTGAWTQLTIPTYPAGNSWNFNAAGNISIPSQFLGQANVRIAFKYTSTTAGAATWEIKNVLIK